MINISERFLFEFKSINIREKFRNNPISKFYKTTEELIQRAEKASNHIEEINKYITKIYNDYKKYKKISFISGGSVSGALLILLLARKFKNKYLNKNCVNLQGIKKLKCQQNVLKLQLNIIKNKYNICDTTKRPAKCKSQFDKELRKIQDNITEINEKIKQVKFK